MTTMRPSDVKRHIWDTLTEKKQPVRHKRAEIKRFFEAHDTKQDYHLSEVSKFLEED